MDAERGHLNVTVPDDIACPACGYELRGITSERCPECGIFIDREATSFSRIPWEHRNQLGLWRAYWRTNVKVWGRPKLLAEEMNRPVDLQRARGFRRITVILAAIPSMVWWAYAYSIYTRRYWPIPVLEGNKLSWFLEALVLTTAVFAVWLFFMAVSGAASYFFHPPHLPVTQQDRAIAISYYAGAPLAWIWIPAVLFALGWGITSLSTRSDDFPLRIATQIYLAASLAGIFVASTFWMVSAALMEKCTKPSRVKRVLFAAYLPCSCVLLFTLCCGLVSAVVLISLMLLSLA